MGRVNGCKKNVIYMYVKGEYYGPVLDKRTLDNATVRQG